MASSATPPAQPPTQRCPSCASQRIWRDGLRQTRNGDVQRYICRDCGHRFSENAWKGSDPSEHVQKIHRIAFYRDPTIAYNRQVCVAETQGAKNLAEVESRTEKRAAGATKPSTADVKGKIVEYAWWMKKQGYKDVTIKGRTGIIKNLVKRRADLFNPESVKEVIAGVDTWSESRKSVVVDAYTSFLKMLGLTWDPPRYVKHHKIPFIPTEKEMDDLIAHCGRKTSAALRIAKETGARIGEILRLKWTEIDKVSRTIRFNAPEKGSNPRILRVSSELINVLEGLPRRNEYVFGTKRGHGKPKDYCSVLRSGRRRAARKLGNPRLLRITFHTARHWKGTMEYHKTKDIIHVKELLGHKSINNTMIYINLERAVFKETSDEFTVRAVDSLEEACKLLEVGFEYVCDMKGKKLFRKRK